MSLTKSMIPEDVRKDFPILNRRVKDHPLVYLDNAATSQKPQSVIKALSGFYETINANVHRGLHTLSDDATDAYESAREKIGSFIGCPDAAQIIFTRNATEAVNLVAASWGEPFLDAGDTIILSAMEHHANLVPWQQLSKKSGVRLQFIDLQKNGQLNMSHFARLLDDKRNAPIKLVAVTHVSNVLGSINPVVQIVQMAHSAGAKVLVDAAQSIPCMPLDAGQMGCDFLVFSSHKMLGPTGIGVLYAKKELLEAMPPFLTGGEMISEVTFHSSQWAELPWKFEAGTPCIAGAVGLGAAVDYLNRIGMRAIFNHEKRLLDFAVKRLSEIENIVIYGPGETDQTGIVSFNIKNVHPHDIAALLDEQGIAVRAGHHCAQPLMGYLNVNGTVRASFYLYNTLNEIDIFVTALQHACRTLGTN